jgi:hypothetical protein
VRQTTRPVCGMFSFFFFWFFLMGFLFTAGREIKRKQRKKRKVTYVVVGASSMYSGCGFPFGSPAAWVWRDPRLGSCQTRFGGRFFWLLLTLICSFFFFFFSHCNFLQFFQMMMCQNGIGCCKRALLQMVRT